jgi:hypothetical protein
MQDVAVYGACPVCAGKQKTVALPDFLEWSEEQEAWVSLTVSVCKKCGRATIHTFRPEMFSSLPTQDRNEELARGVSA